MCHDQLDYASRIRASGFRMTPQRQMILDAICASGGHTTFDEILARVQARAPALNRATVYRTLDFLCDLRLVVALELDGQTRYEIAGATPHHHLVCRACGQVQALDDALLDSVKKAVKRRHHFKVDMDHIALLGLCEYCQHEESKSSSHDGARTSKS